MVDPIQRNNVYPTDIKEIIASLKTLNESSQNNLVTTDHKQTENSNVLQINRNSSRSSETSVLECKHNEKHITTLNIKKPKVLDNNPCIQSSTKSNIKHYFKIEKHKTPPEWETGSKIIEVLNSLKNCKDRIHTTRSTIYPNNYSAVNIDIPGKELNKSQIEQDDINKRLSKGMVEGQRISNYYKVNHLKQLRISPQKEQHTHLINYVDVKSMGELTENPKVCNNDGVNTPDIHKLPEDNQSKYMKPQKNNQYLNTKNNFETLISIIKNKNKNNDKDFKDLGMTKNGIVASYVESNSYTNNKTTFDDFCSNVVQDLNSKSKINKNVHKEKVVEVSNKENMFPKSCSMGQIEQKHKRNKRELNSLPITDFEIKCKTDRLKKRKLSFDDFIKDIVKNVNNNESNQAEQNIFQHFMSDSLNDRTRIENTSLTNNIGNEFTSIENLLTSPKQETKGKQVIQTSSQDCIESTIRSKSRKHVEYDIYPHHNVDNVKSSFENCQINIDSKVSVENNGVDASTSLKDADVNCKRSYIVNNTNNNQMEEYESEDFLLYCSNLVQCPEDTILSKPLVTPNDEQILQSKSQIDILYEENQQFIKDITSKTNILDPGVPVKNTLSYNNNNGFSNNSTMNRELRLEHCLNRSDNSTLKNNLVYTLENTEVCGTVNEIFKNGIFSENKKSLESFEEYNSNNLLENNPVDLALSSNNESCKVEDSEAGIESKLLFEDFLENFTKGYKNKLKSKIGNVKQDQQNKPIRRYKKGKMKIYKIKRLRRPRLKTSVVEQVKENLKFDDLFKKITQDIVKTEHSLSRSKSMSSISTTSSYITDLTKSEILSTGSNELSSPQRRLRKGINELSKDKTLLCPDMEWENIINDSKDEIKMKIQDVFLKVGEDFLEKKNSVLKYRKHSFNNCIFKDGRLQLKPLNESSMTMISSAAARSQAKFKLILYIMKKIQMLLETNTKLTKRELYYQVKSLVKDQRVIDRIINAISSLLNVGMWRLNIIAQKGLVFGNLKILLTSGETLNCNIPGTLIPQDINEIVEIHSQAYFILVVEKESIFHKLIDDGLPERLTRPFIMITGKGFPDLNTQLFLKKLWMIMSIPVFILVDADPHGINIMLNYRFGSVNNAHVSHHLAVPNAKWLGVFPSEVVNLNLTKELLSEREVKLVHHLLRTPYIEYNSKIINELNILLEKKYKAEIEGLLKSDTFLSDVYLPNKFFTHNFI